MKMLNNLGEMMNIVVKKVNDDRNVTIVLFDQLIKKQIKETYSHLGDNLTLLYIDNNIAHVKNLEKLQRYDGSIEHLFIYGYKKLGNLKSDESITAIANLKRSIDKVVEPDIYLYLIDDEPPVEKKEYKVYTNRYTVGSTDNQIETILKEAVRDEDKECIYMTSELTKAEVAARSNLFVKDNIKIVPFAERESLFTLRLYLEKNDVDIVVIDKMTDSYVEEYCANLQSLAIKYQVDIYINVQKPRKVVEDKLTCNVTDFEFRDLMIDPKTLLDQEVLPDNLCMLISGKAGTNKTTKALEYASIIDNNITDDSEILYLNDEITYDQLQYIVHEELNLVNIPSLNVTLKHKPDGLTCNDMMDAMIHSPNKVKAIVIDAVKYVDENVFREKMDTFKYINKLIKIPMIIVTNLPLNK